MTQPDVATIIVNWKLKEETLACIRSVEQLREATRIIVVDNGSDDGSVEYLAQHAPNIELLVMPQNYGFGRACNAAIKHALQDPQCEYILLLNNDAVIEPAAVAALRAAAEQNPQAGILGCKMYYHDCPDTFWYAGARRRRYVLAAADTGRGCIDRGQFDARHEVDYVFGAAMFIRRAVFEAIGYFDEQFFLYLEDLDFCLTAQQSGFSIRFVPDAHIWHSVSASTRHDPGMRRYYMVKSTILFLQKHTTPPSFLLVLLFWSLVYMRVLLSDLLQGHSAVVQHYWSGLVHGLQEVLRPERNLPAERRICGEIHTTSLKLE